MIKKAKRIIEKLNKAGFEAYVVGGAVRDYLLGNIPNDIDITTDATPEDVINIFKNVIPTGIKYGTVTVLVDNTGFEVTTFRADGNYSDGRRPDEVMYSTLIEDDLSRRDFTINSMAMDLDENIIDIFGGREDIGNGIIRCVGNPVDRFTEDGLRILRAFRFSARFGFDIESETLEAIKAKKENILNVSAERVNDEITKTLMTDNTFKTFLLMYDTGVLGLILPEVSNLYEIKQNNYNHIYDVFIHTLKTVESVPKDIVLRWTMLLHDIGKIDTKVIKGAFEHFPKHNIRSVELAKEILNRLKFSNSMKDEILELIMFHMDKISTTDVYARKLLNKINHTTIDKWAEVRKADYMAQNPDMIKSKFKALNKLLFLTSKEKRILVKDLAINGNDLIAKGLKGKEIGDTLERLLELVLENPKINNKESLINLI